MDNIKIGIKCPICSTILISEPITNEEGNYFQIGMYDESEWTCTNDKCKIEFKLDVIGTVRKNPIKKKEMN